MPEPSAATRYQHVERKIAQNVDSGTNADDVDDDDDGLLSVTPLTSLPEFYKIDRLNSATDIYNIRRQAFDGYLNWIVADDVAMLAGNVVNVDCVFCR